MSSRPWKRSRLSLPASSRRRSRRSRFGSIRWYTGRPRRFGRTLNDYGVPRGIAGAGFTSSSTTLLNPSASGFTRIKSTILNAKTFTGTNMSTTFNGNLVMNPAGTSGNFHNGVAITDWSSYATVFDEYKVNSIIVTVRVSGQDDSIASVPEIWMSSSRDNALAGSLTDLQVKANVTHHIFTQDNPVCKLLIKPYTLALVMNDTGTVVGSTKTPELCGWLDTEAPSNLYGYLFFLKCPQDTSALTTTTVTMDIEYDISWRYRSG